MTCSLSGLWVKASIPGWYVLGFLCTTVLVMKASKLIVSILRLKWSHLESPCGEYIGGDSCVVHTRLGHIYKHLFIPAAWSVPIALYQSSGTHPSRKCRTKMQSRKVAHGIQTAGFEGIQKHSRKIKNNGAPPTACTNASTNAIDSVKSCKISYPSSPMETRS